MARHITRKELKKDQICEGFVHGAEAVASQTNAGLETILKKPAEQGFVFRQCHHAIAEVAGRKDAVLAPRQRPSSERGKPFP